MTWNVCQDIQSWYFWGAYKNAFFRKVLCGWPFSVPGILVVATTVDSHNALRWISGDSVILAKPASGAVCRSNTLCTWVDILLLYPSLYFTISIGEAGRRWAAVFFCSGQILLIHPSMKPLPNSFGTYSCLAAPSTTRVRASLIRSWCMICPVVLSRELLSL